MSKHKHAKPVHPRQRNFPNDYTREDLIAQLVAMGAECYRQAEQIEALMQRICELEAECSLQRGEQHGVDGEMDVNGYRRHASDFLGRFDSVGLVEQGGYSSMSGQDDGFESEPGRDFSVGPDMESAETCVSNSAPASGRRTLIASAPRPVFRVFDVSM